MKSVCVFCGSSPGNSSSYADTARELGRALAAHGLALVYGGGRVGLMGEVASSALAAGGAVVGVIPHSLALKEIAQEDCTELVVVNTMHERKALMADRSDAFVALPGGYGTCDELFEILTWAQLGIHRKPVAILNTNGFFTPLLAWLDHIVTEGLLKSKHRALLVVADSVPELLAKLTAWVPAEPTTKWVTPEER
ncbi:TIGR00730 family Rossman fold protein [Gemmata sp. G18]|uniref:Cytokinin riboside 5'-monophosphate phosphoribohydrolase n=1 Tax=Gemmata palustris TaxID=2822762 RepID=A0ABS5C374_9BACT|nr:TIGR00730 family Rossman fold protein [Gemmata palustris]MBP3960426.1 TIGR00730 family Rossman fold protein [Gemmata palustris]